MATIPLPQLKEGEEDIYSFGFDKLLYRDPPRQDEFLAGGDLDSQFGVYDGGVIGGYGKNIIFSEQRNTFVGIGVGTYNTGLDNTALGADSLYFNSSGRSNVAIGAAASRTGQTGWYNTSVGAIAGYANISAWSNTAIGAYALRWNRGSSNTALGSFAAWSNITGTQNTAIGYQSLYRNLGTLNVALGYESLWSNTSGHYNTALGNWALYANSTGLRNIAIGQYAGYYETDSNAFYVNNQNRTDTAGDKSKSILYGVMAADPANQKLTINALLNQSIAKTPATAAAAGTKGDICWDANYIYIAVDTDTWKRVGIATW